MKILAERSIDIESYNDRDVIEIIKNEIPLLKEILTNLIVYRQYKCILREYSDFINNKSEVVIFIKV